MPIHPTRKKEKRIMRKIGAIYARVSSTKQKEDATILSQIDCLVTKAREDNYIIPEGYIFTDDGVSGTRIDRPALDNLREMVSDGHVNAIFIYDHDRLSRNFVHLILLEEEFRKSNIDIIYYKAPEPKTPQDTLSHQIRKVIAEYERTQIIERCRRGRYFKAKQGSVSVLTHAPYGYEYVKIAQDNGPDFRIVDQQANVVRQIFSWYVYDDWSIRKIGLELDKKGILPPEGGKTWNPSTTSRVLGNTTYIGKAYFGKRERYEGVPGRIFKTRNKVRKDKAYEARRMRPEDQWIEIPVPIIVDEEIFYATQKKLKQNQALSARNTKVPALLQGILTCKECGNPYYKKRRRTSKKVYELYTCKTNLTGGKCPNASIRCSELDELIWNHLIELLRSPKLIETEIKRRLQNSDEKSGKKEKQNELEKEIIRLKNSMNKLLDAYQSGDCLTLDQLKDRMGKLKKMLKENEKKLSCIIMQQKDCEKTFELSKIVQNFRERLDKARELPITEQQRVVRSLIYEIVIGEKIEVNHCISFQNVVNGPLRCDRSVGHYGL